VYIVHRSSDIRQVHLENRKGATSALPSKCLLLLRGLDGGRKDATKLAVFRYNCDYFGIGQKLCFRDDSSQITRLIKFLKDDSHFVNEIRSAFPRRAAP
jgi:hypothetical protein